MAKEVAEYAAVAVVAGMVLPTDRCTCNPAGELHQ
jgi:hypothetical protein